MILSGTMEEMTRAQRQSVINAIAIRLGTARELATRFDMPVAELREFVKTNRAAIEAAKRRLEGTGAEEPPPDVVTPTQLEELWISNKFERLKRLQDVADETYKAITDGSDSTAEMAIVVREFRSYLMLAANELGQLLHRGSGDAGTGDTLNVSIDGVDMEQLR